MVFARVPEVLPDQQEIRSEGSKKEKRNDKHIYGEKSAGKDQINPSSTSQKSLPRRQRYILLIVKDDVIKKNNLSLYDYE